MTMFTFAQLHVMIQVRGDGQVFSEHFISYEAYALATAPPTLCVMSVKQPLPLAGSANRYIHHNS
jgi:hypothetical protein